jgi:hypothetical protein
VSVPASTFSLAENCPQESSSEHSRLWSWNVCAPSQTADLLAQTTVRSTSSSLLCIVIYLRYAESPEWSQAFRDGFRFTISEDRSSLQGFYPAPPARGKRVRKPINVTFPVPSAIGPLPNDWQPPTSASERVPNPHPATLWAWHILDNMATQCADGPASDLMLGEESGKLDWQSWSSRFRDVRRMKDWSNRAALFAAIGRWPQPNVLIPELSSQSAGEALAV